MADNLVRVFTFLMIFNRKEGGCMKKIGLLLILVTFLIGCGTAAQRSEFYKHDTQFKNWEHLKFSVLGWKKPTQKDVQETKNQD